jgi:hypothetical protein
MKIRPVATKLFHPDRQADGRRDTTKFIVEFRNFAKAPKNVKTTEWALLLLTLFRKNLLVNMFFLFITIFNYLLADYTTLRPHIYTGWNRITRTSLQG